ncbi:MAG: c-type cytochrome [Hyphomicrobium sp.]
MGVSTGSRAGHADDAVDPAAAAKQFLNSCGTCHTVEDGAPIRQGPNLKTVLGRKAGTLAEFPAYSDAIKAAGAGGLVWSEETLDAWISDASTFIPGSSMPYAQPDAAKRKLVIAYLKSLSGGPTKAGAE